MSSYKLSRSMRAVRFLVVVGMSAAAKLSQFIGSIRHFGHELMSKLAEVIAPSRDWVASFFKVLFARAQVDVRIDKVRSFFVFLRVKNGWISG